jgi:hypothetical protein
MRFAHLKVTHRFERMRLRGSHRRPRRVPPRGYRAEPQDTRKPAFLIWVKCFSPSTISPFLRVSSYRDRSAQLTGGACSFLIPRELRVRSTAVIGVFFAVDRRNMRRIFIEIRSPDPNLFAVRIDPLPQVFT